jgi:hypothetical protein
MELNQRRPMPPRHSYERSKRLAAWPAPVPVLLVQIVTSLELTRIFVQKCSHLNNPPFTQHALDKLHTQILWKAYTQRCRLWRVCLAHTSGGTAPDTACDSASSGERFAIIDARSTGVITCTGGGAGATAGTGSATFLAGPEGPPGLGASITPPPRGGALLTAPAIGRDIIACAIENKTR